MLIAHTVRRAARNLFGQARLADLSPHWMHVSFCLFCQSAAHFVLKFGPRYEKTYFIHVPLRTPRAQTSLRLRTA